MKKRALSLLLVLVMVFGLLPPIIHAEDLIIEPYALIIKEYEDHVEIIGYAGRTVHIEVPAEVDGVPVTVIGEKAFQHCSDLITVILPDTITHIEDYAFGSCWYLSKINLPDSLVSIGQGAFEHCSNLTDIFFPSSLVSIGQEAFQWCSALTTINIPKSTTFIGECAFRNCSELTHFFVDTANPNYSSDSYDVLFDKGRTTLLQAPAKLSGSYLIPRSVTRIGPSAFSNCGSLSSISIPNSVTTIGNDAFINCGRLKSIVIPDSVSHIGDFAFTGCSGLSSITIPQSVTHIGAYAFNTCRGLTEIYVDEDNPNYTSDSRGVLFDKEKTKLIQAPCGITSTYVIPDGVVAIGDAAFDFCRSLTGITIPDSVTVIGESAFNYCTGLSRIIIPSGVTSISSHAFSCCFALTDVSIPDSVISIDSQAFLCCSALTDITIPDSVSYIGSFCFSECSSLRSIRFEGHAPEMSTLSFDAVTASAYYPLGDPTWTNEVMHNYSGNLTWIPYNPDNPFRDVPVGSFYEEPVLWALENGITTGASADSFNPNGQCLRAQVVTFLHRAARNPAPGNANNPFTDVKTSDFFYAPVLWAVENGITNGTGATTFGSYDVCNRAAVVTFLWRAAGSPEPESADNPFTDVRSSDFFYKPVLWAIENGITNGISATAFGPTSPCNRAQVVTFLYRAYN